MKVVITVILFFINFWVSAQHEFISVWKPSIPQTFSIQAPYASSNQQIWFPGIGNNFTISWEEIGYPTHYGTLTGITSTKQILIDFGIAHNPISQNATYRIKITNGNGAFNRILFNDEENYPSYPTLYGDSYKIISIEQWGTINWTSMVDAFNSCNNMNVTATDFPNLTQVNSLRRMFSFCEKLVGNSSFNTWNTSTITDLKQTFYNAKLFNQPIGNWNVSNVTNLIGTFSFATIFNQNINSWNVSNVTSFQQLFWAAAEFNQPLNSWNTSNLTSLEETFWCATKFNQPLSNWNVSNVSSFRRTFVIAKAFNQPLDMWNLSNAVNIGEMFSGATLFNQPLNSWNISNVTMMNGMFMAAQNFNQDINNWNTSNVQFMDGVFWGAINFNKPLNSWNTANVYDMQRMFKDAYSYNQSMPNWNLSSLDSANDMLKNSGLTCANYTSTLIGWANNLNTPNNINFGSATPLFYNQQGQASRNILLTKNWQITGDYLGNCNLSVNDIESVHFQIYPNPASDFIYIKTKENLKQFKIYDNSGRVILKDTPKNNKINIKNLIRGNYILELKFNEYRKQFKFIKI